MLVFVVGTMAYLGIQFQSTLEIQNRSLVFAPERIVVAHDTAGLWSHRSEPHSTEGRVVEVGQIG